MVAEGDFHRFRQVQRPLSGAQGHLLLLQQLHIRHSDPLHGLVAEENTAIGQSPAAEAVVQHVLQVCHLAIQEAVSSEVTVRLLFHVVFPVAVQFVGKLVGGQLTGGLGFNEALVGLDVRVHPAGGLTALGLALVGVGRQVRVVELVGALVVVAVVQGRSGLRRADQMADGGGGKLAGGHA